MIKKFICAFTISLMTAGAAHSTGLECDRDYSVVRGDSLSKISLRSYNSLLYQPIYTANIDTIGSNPDLILVGQSLFIPCLTPATATIETIAPPEDVLVLTFNKASAPPFILNSGIVDNYLAEITEATEGRVRFIDPEVVNREHSEQFELVMSGQVDGAYVLNSTIADSHPLLRLPMLPMLGGSAEQTAVSLWRLHEEYLSQSDYFDDAHLLGFVAAPAAHIWRSSGLPITAEEGITTKNRYFIPYFMGLDTLGPAVMRKEMNKLLLMNEQEPAAYFMAHGAAVAVGLWNAEADVTVMEVDNGVYTPSFSIILSNEAWAKISPEDQRAIDALSGEALAFRSAAWDEFDNAFRSRMLDNGLDFEKADQDLLLYLWQSSFEPLNDWIEEAENLGISGTDAAVSYMSNLRSLEDRLIYRSEETFVDQHPFFTGSN